MIKALKDSGEDMRETAAEALGKIGVEAKAATRPLAELLSDANVDVRRVPPPRPWVKLARKRRRRFLN